MDFYFSKIETFDQQELCSYTFYRKKERKARRRDKKLENFGIFVGKTSAKLLKKAEQFDKYVSTLKLENPEKAAELDQRKAWEMARLKAQGVKVKTDVALIRKSANRIRSLKKKSCKNWQERIRRTQEESDLKQKKRRRNLQRRSDAKREKKYKKMVKKGHILPQLQD